MSKDKKVDKKIQSQVEELTNQVAELTNNWKRAVADYRNQEARMAKEKEEWIKFGNVALVLPLLEVLDDLERAAIHLNDNGLNLVVEKFQRLLKDSGVTQMQVAGQFDPQTMECVEQVAGEKDKIVSIEQKGYLYHDRLLRPAKVKVGKG